MWIDCLIKFQKPEQSVTLESSFQLMILFRQMINQAGAGCTKPKVG
jgi:hypothetical protein